MAERKRPEVAILASWLIPGLGQIYLGARRRGLLFAALYLGFAVPIWAQLAPYLVLIWPALAVWVSSQVDVWRRAGVRPRDYLAGTRFRHRLFGRRGSEERALRRDRILRKVLGAAFLLTGVWSLARGL